MAIMIRIIVLICTLFFAVGALFAWYGKLDSNTFILITGIVGSIASVIGLIALAAPRLTTDDIRNVEADLLNSVARQAKAAKELEDKLATNRDELTKLERERAEVELIVRQAGLKLFMEERMRYLSEEIEKRISADIVLDDLLIKYDSAFKQAQLLNAEISRNEKTELIRKILEDVKHVDHPEIKVKFMGIEVNIRPILDLFKNAIVTAARFP